MQSICICTYRHVFPYDRISMWHERKMSRELRQSIASHRREMLDFARELIAIPTENPPGAATRECAAVVRDRLHRMKLSIQPKTPAGTIRSVYGRGQRTLYFHGHY